MEVDDQAEWDFLLGVFDNMHQFMAVRLGAVEVNGGHGGHWKFLTSGVDMTFKAWWSGSYSGNGKCLWSVQGIKYPSGMFDWVCHSFDHTKTYPLEMYKFVCEIE